MECIIDDVLVGPINGSLYGSPELVDGKIGQALHTDGISQYVNFGNQRHICPGNLDLCSEGLTLMLWLKIADAPHSHTFEFYISNGGHHGDSHGIALSRQGGLLRAHFRMLNGSFWKLETSRPDFDLWYHIAVAWRSDIGCQMYYDGTLQGELLLSETGTANTNNNDLIIGMANNIIQPNPTYGRAWYDDLRFYYEYKHSTFIQSVMALAAP